jgi:cell division protein YceG involved in septum cleavage
MRCSLQGRQILRGSALALVFAATACGSGSGPAVRVTIPSGANMRVASDSLAKAGVIHYSRLFRVYAS